MLGSKPLDRLILSATDRWIRSQHPGQARFYAELARQAGMPSSPANPVCCNDKFFWRKVFDHDPRYPVIMDKLALKQWVTEEGIGVATARVLWTGRDPAAIPESVLAGDVVMKANHAYKTNFVIRGGTYDRAELVAAGRRFLRSNHGSGDLQWGYGPIARTLFVEELLGGSGPDLVELKYYMGGSEIEQLVMIYERFSDIAVDIWYPDSAGVMQLSDEPSAISNRSAGHPLPSIERHAAEVAREIGRRFDHMRVDFYTDGTELWLGELTPYNLGGLISVRGQIKDFGLNTAWDLRRSWFLSSPQTGWRGVYAGALRRELDRRERSDRPRKQVQA